MSDTNMTQLYPKSKRVHDLMGDLIGKAR